MGPLFASSVALALVAAAPSDEPVQPITIEAAQDPNENLISQYYDELYAGRLNEALATARRLQIDPANKQGIAVADAMQAAALLGLKRDAEASRLIDEMTKVAPGESHGLVELFEDAVFAKRYDAAADAFDELIAHFPDAARDQRIELVSFFLRNEPKGQDQRNDDRRIALARLGYAAGTGDGRWIAFDAVKRLVRRGDIAGANELLPNMEDPQLFENMLIQKRYSALWPRLEQIGGAHLSKVRDGSVAEAEHAYFAAPDDHEKLQFYVDALRRAGRLNEAIALKAKLPLKSEAMAAVDEKTGWAVNNLAYALYETGQGDEGDRLFAMLNEPERADAGWRVSMIINRLEMLVTGGKFEKAATLIDATELSAKNDGNAYAQQLVRRLRYCILSSLGKKEDAAAILPDVLKHADDALQPTVDGLLCGGETDKAEQLVLQALSTADKDKREKFEELFVRALQPVLLTDDDPSVWQGRWAALRKRPAIAREYQRLGRDMPAELLPVRSAATAAK